MRFRMFPLKHGAVTSAGALMLEFEVKAPAPIGVDAVIARLVAAGAKARGVHRQVDVYYAHPVRDYAATDEALRVRRVTTGGIVSTEVTYKGPKRDARTKTRREITLAIADGDAPAFLEDLGFRPVARVAKTRSAFALGLFEVDVDEVDDLGTFVEVECLIEEGVATAHLESGAFALLEKLGCGAPERRSYLELLLKRAGL